MSEIFLPCGWLNPGVNCPEGSGVLIPEAIQALTGHDPAQTDLISPALSRILD